MTECCQQQDGATDAACAEKSDAAQCAGGAVDVELTDAPAAEPCSDAAACTDGAGSEPATVDL